MSAEVVISVHNHIKIPRQLTCANSDKPGNVCVGSSSFFEFIDVLLISRREFLELTGS